MQRNIEFTLNGRPVTAQVGNHQNLVEVLQGQGLFGARESCAQGLCGCCTVIVNGAAVSGCLTLAPLIDGADVRTIEESQADGQLDPVQQAFVETGAFQCGFCTPGIVMRLAAIAPEQRTDAAVRQALLAHVCRCTGWHTVMPMRHVLFTCPNHLNWNTGHLLSNLDCVHNVVRYATSTTKPTSRVKTMHNTFFNCNATCSRSRQ